MLGFRVTGLLALCLVIASSGVARAQCSKDTDCKGQRVCEVERCVDPPVTAPQVTPVQPAPTAVPVVIPAQAPAAPAVATPAPNQTRRHSPGLMAVGIVMVSLGAVTLLGTMGTAIAAGVCESQTEYDGSGAVAHRQNCDAYEPVLLGLSLSGVGLLGAGIPLAVIGGRREPAEGPGVARVTPWLAQGGGGARLAVGF